MDRQHAKEAVRLLRKGTPKGLGKLNCTNPEAVRMATDLALGLEKGEPPEWYKLLEKELATESSKQTPQEENHSPFSSLRTEHSSTKEDDDFVEEDVISLSSSSSEESTPANMLCPEWYDLLENELVTESSKQTPQEEKHSSFSTFQTEQSSMKEEDDFVEEDVISLSSSSREGSTPTNMLDTSGGHSKWKLETLPSSGIITTKSPPPNLELPLIADGSRRAFTFSAQNGWRELVPPVVTLDPQEIVLTAWTSRKNSLAMTERNKLSSTAIGERSGIYSGQKERKRIGRTKRNHTHIEKFKPKTVEKNSSSTIGPLRCCCNAVTTKLKRRKCFEEMLKTRIMEKSSISSEYWEIPFDPLRESVLSSHKIFKMEKLESENELDVSLSKKEILEHTDYWEIQKIMRFVRIGNPTATVLALCALKELDIEKPSCNEIIRHLHGVSLFLNILDTDSRRCRVAALNVLVCLASSPKTSNLILKRNGMRQLVSILGEDDEAVVAAACDVVSFLAKHIDVRTVAIKMNIVEKLMSVFKTRAQQTLREGNLRLFRSVCSALWSCCLSTREKDAEIISESLGAISRLVETHGEEIAVPLLGIVEECASVEYFRCKLEQENFIEKVISKMKTGSECVKLLSIKILFKCASDARSQKTLLKSNNIQEIMKLFKQNYQGRNDELLTLLLGIIWRCSLYKKYREKFENYDVFPLVLNILKSDKNLQVKSAALGVLSELLWDKAYTDSLRSHEVINLLIDFMSVNEPAILVHSARSLGVCARNKAWRKTILQYDGLRLLWSLLKNSDEEVVSSGAVALASVCAYPEESANAVRSIVGGIELLMKLFAASEPTKCNVLICLCEAAVSIANDKENRSILIDYDLISVLLKLCESKNAVLRYYVTHLISRCCECSKERNVLSQCIPYLIEGLRDDFDDHVHFVTICALKQLSRDFANCVFLRENNTTKTIMNMLGSNNEKIQDAAAECLANVRKSVMGVSVG